MQKSVQIPQDQRKYFLDVDRSILHWSVQHSRLAMQAQGALQTLETLYQTRATHLNEQLRAAGLDMASVQAARYDEETGSVVVDLKDDVSAEGPPSNGS